MPTTEGIATSTQEPAAEPMRNVAPAAGLHTPPEPWISVVIPVYNEEGNIAELHRRLTSAVAALGRGYEIIFVNDGSKDGTPELLAGIADADMHVTVLTFARNYGQTAAMTAGIDFAAGEVIVCMDSDLQNDPNDIKRLIEVLEQGNDVVCGWRQERNDPILRVITSRIANGIISRVSGVHLHDYGCTLKAFRHDVIKNVRLYGEMHRFIPIYASQRGANIKEIPVTHHPRTRGKSNYGFERTIKVMLDLMVVKFLSTYATKPIYVFGGFGFLSLFLSMLCVVAALVFKIIPQDFSIPAEGQWHKDLIKTPLPVFAVGLFIVGVQMILIGLLAEVQMRTYYESQQKLTYQIKSVRGARRLSSSTSLQAVGFEGQKRQG
jgi:glycosyltransferase involved in cell wall biosynthesis